MNDHPGAPEGNRVSRTAILLLVASTGALLGAIVLFAAGAFVRDSILLPLARRMSSDGVLSPAFMDRLDGMRRMLGKGALAAALASGGLAYLWERARRRLPAEARIGGEAPPPASPPRWIDGLVLCAAGLLLVVGFRDFLRSGLEYDELFTNAHFVRAPTAWDTVSTYLAFNNHVGYSLLARLCVGWMGWSEFALRLPAILFGLLSLPLAWALGARLSGRTAGAAAALLLSISPAFGHWSASARGYTGMAFFTLLSGLAYLSLLRKPTARAALLLASATGLGAWMHFCSGFATVAQAAHLGFLVFREGRPPPERRTLSFRSFRLAFLGLAGGVALALLLHAPVLHRILAEILVRGSEGRPTSSLTAAVLASFGGEGGVASVVPLLLLAAWGAACPSPGSRDDRTYLLVLATVPLGLSSILGLGGLFPRFFLFVLPPIAVLAAAGVGDLAARAGRAASVGIPWMRGLAWAGLLLAAGAPVLGSYPLRQAEPGVRETCGWLREEIARGATPCAVGEDFVLLETYLGRAVRPLRTPLDLEKALAEEGRLVCVWIPVTGSDLLYADLIRALDATLRREERNGQFVFVRK